MFWLIPLALLVIVAFIISRFTRSVEQDAQWLYNFESLKFSAEEFYKSCEEHIEKREIPYVKFSRVVYPDDRLGASRTYLHIVRHDYIFDVCCAHFGAGSFVSIWAVEKHGLVHKILHLIPLVKNFLGRKTYFQADTEAVFKSAVHAGVMEAIDGVTTSKGVRALTQDERRIPMKARAV